MVALQSLAAHGNPYIEAGIVAGLACVVAFALIRYNMWRKDRIWRRVLVESERTDYPLVYALTGLRVTIDQNTLAVEGSIQQRIPLSSVFLVSCKAEQVEMLDGPPQLRRSGRATWHVHCFPENDEPTVLNFGSGEGEVAARVVAHKASVDIDSWE